jgi:hypothetical protein
VDHPKALIGGVEEARGTFDINIHVLHPCKNIPAFDYTAGIPFELDLVDKKYSVYVGGLSVTSKA